MTESNNVRMTDDDYIDHALSRSMIMPDVLLADIARI